MTLESGGWLVALISSVALVARETIRLRKHRANNALQEKVSEREHDAAIAPLLAARVESLERRLDERDAKIDALEKGHADCERRNDACEQRAKGLESTVRSQGEAIREMRAEFARVRSSITPRPFPATSAETKPHGGEESE